MDGRLADSASEAQAAYDAVDAVLRRDPGVRSGDAGRRVPSESPGSALDGLEAFTPSPDAPGPASAPSTPSSGHSALDALALAAAALLALGMIQRAQPLMALAWLALAVLALVVLVAGWVPGQGADSTGEDWDTW